MLIRPYAVLPFRALKNIFEQVSKSLSSDLTELAALHHTSAMKTRSGTVDYNYEAPRTAKKATRRARAPSLMRSVFKGRLPAHRELVRTRYGRISRRRPSPAAYGGNPQGLRNPGAFCYRISMLQCLLHLAEFNNYLDLRHQTCTKIVRECTFCAMKQLSAAYWYNRSPANFPHGAVNDLHDAVEHCCKDEYFKEHYCDENVQGDSHDFLLQLLEMLRAQDHHWSTRIDRFFFFHSKASWTCDDCGTISDRAQPELGFSVSITDPEEGLELMDYIRAHLALPAVSLRCDSDHCVELRAEQAEQALVDEQLGLAKPQEDSKTRERTLSVQQIPEFLVVQLMRFGYDEKGALKIRTRVSYPDILDLTEFNVDNTEPLLYQLQGVVAHKGPTLTNGHYIAAVRRQDDRGFATINDHRVDNGIGATVSRLLQPRSGSYFDPYILVYVKMANDN